MRLMALAQVAHLLNCMGNFSSTLIKGYSTDSRSLKLGELFFALKGERVDGHAYLKEVQQKGAIAAVVAEDYEGFIEGLCLLKVPDPLHALQELARKVLFSSPSRIVAITGSLGKTSTKEFTRTLLSTQYQVGCSPGNSNSQVGIPLTILNHTTGEEEIFVFEMGMTAPGHLKRLVEIAPPEVAVITTVALVHASGFESLDDIARAKAEIFSHPQTQLGILHYDIPNFLEIVSSTACRKFSFSMTSLESDYRLGIENSQKIESCLENHNLLLENFSVPGKHNIKNLMAAIAVARYFKVDWEKIEDAISELTLPERRLQWVHHKGMLFLNDSYNASEVSVKAALETLPEPAKGGRKIAVLGEMAELGKFSVGCHQRIGEFALQHVERLYCFGDECLPACEIWQMARRPVEFFRHWTDLMDCLRRDLQPQDVILLKGSRSKQMWKVLEEL